MDDSEILIVIGMIQLETILFSFHPDRGDIRIHFFSIDFHRNLVDLHLMGQTRIPGCPLDLLSVTIKTQCSQVFIDDLPCFQLPFRPKRPAFCYVTIRLVILRENNIAEPLRDIIDIAEV